MQNPTKTMVTKCKKLTKNTIHESWSFPFTINSIVYNFRCASLYREKSFITRFDHWLYFDSSSMPPNVAKQADNLLVVSSLIHASVSWLRSLSNIGYLTWFHFIFYNLYAILSVYSFERSRIIFLTNSSIFFSITN